VRDISTFLPFGEGFSVVTIKPDGDALQIDLAPRATRFPSCGVCQKTCSTAHEYCERVVRDLPILEIGQVTAAVQCQVFHRLVGDFLKLLLVAAFNPARRVDEDRLVGALDLAFLFQAAGDHIELQHADGAEDDVVDAYGEEHLGSAFFGQLLQALAQLLGFSGSRRRTRRNSSGAKCGMPVKPRLSPSLKVSPIWMVPWLCKPMMTPSNP